MTEHFLLTVLSWRSNSFYHSTIKFTGNLAKKSTKSCYQFNFFYIPFTTDTKIKSQSFIVTICAKSSKTPKYSCIMFSIIKKNVIWENIDLEDQFYFFEYQFCSKIHQLCFYNCSKDLKFLFLSSTFNKWNIKILLAI